MNQLFDWIWENDPSLMELFMFPAFLSQENDETVTSADEEHAETTESSLPDVLPILPRGKNP